MGVVMRKTIDKALEWAYRDELPKEGAAGRLKGPRMATPGWVRAAETWAARIDTANAYGLMPDLAAASPPHPAAIALHELTACLDDVAFAAPLMEPFGDWLPSAAGDELDLLSLASAAALDRALVGVEGGALRPRRSLAALLRRCALLGAPRCLVDHPSPRPQVRTVLSKQGQRKWFRSALMPVRFDDRGRPTAFATTESDDGWCQSRRRPHPGAYTKSCLSPDPAAIADDRVEWLIWRLSLDVVAQMAAEAVFSWGGFERVTIAEMGLTIVPSALPTHPWMEASSAPIQEGSGSKCLN